MDRTGHHSLDGLRPYTRTTDIQQQQVSKIMTRASTQMSVIKEMCDFEKTQSEELGAKIKGIINNHGEITGCVFNINVT